MADAVPTDGDVLSEKVLSRQEEVVTEKDPAVSGSTLQVKRDEELETLRNRSVEESGSENKADEVDGEEEKGGQGEQEAGEQTDDSAAPAATYRPSKASVVSVMKAAIDSSAQQKKTTSSTSGPSVKRWKRPAGAKPGEDGTLAGGGVVLDLESFYKAQKAKSAGEKKKKGEAAKLLHGYRGVASGDSIASSLPGESAMSKYQLMLNRKRKELLPRQVRRGDSVGKLAAANRAAAASYFGATKSSTPGAVPATSSPAGTTSSESKEGQRKSSQEIAAVMTPTEELTPPPEESTAQRWEESEQQKAEVPEQTAPVETPAPLSVAEEIPSVSEMTTEEAPEPPKLVAHKGETTASFMKADYRSFVFAVHPEHGLMLLNSTKKKKKGPHFQLPGGHVDDDEFESAEGMMDGDPASQLMTAGKMAAARELFEETGIDVRGQLDRLQPASLRPSDTEEELECEHNKRLYYFMSVEDSDFKKDTSDGNELAETSDMEKLVKPSGEHGADLMLKLSDEHSGFTFESEPAVSAELLRAHSDGCGSEALQMAMNGEALSEDQIDAVAGKGAVASTVMKVGKDEDAVEGSADDNVAKENAAESTAEENVEEFEKDQTFAEETTAESGLSATDAGEKAVEEDVAVSSSAENAEVTTHPVDTLVASIETDKDPRKTTSSERVDPVEDGAALESFGRSSEGSLRRQSIRNVSEKGKVTPVGAAEQSMVTCRIHGADHAKKIAKKPTPQASVGDTLEAADLLAKPKLRVGSQLVSCNPFFCCGVDDD